jgi:hypothetical protein
MTANADAKTELIWEGRKLEQGGHANGAENQGFSATRLGQRYPHHYPHRRDFENVTDDPLGEPLTIGRVALLLGCSVWTVRHRYLPSGLPYFRIGRSGKLMFYRNQIVQWILEKQLQKGGEVE